MLQVHIKVSPGSDQDKVSFFAVARRRRGQNLEFIKYHLMSFSGAGVPSG